jgi:hypothetical protein
MTATANFSCRGQLNRSVHRFGGVVPVTQIADRNCFEAFDMKLTNDCYLVRIGTKNFTERYYRDKAGWLKVSARGRKFRMTAEQVLNHVLPALAGIKRNLNLTVEHRDLPAHADKVTDKPPLAKRRS